MIDQYERNITEIEADLKEQKTDTSEADKYDILHAKDKEMTEFMENFDETKEKEMAQVEDLESTISQLLFHMSSNMGREGQMPSKEEYGNLKDEKDYKKGLLGDAENTFARVKVELDQRQGDLEKIDNLEVKIEKENKTMNDKLENM